MATDLRTTAETATYLGVHPQTLATWRHEGRGPRFVKVGAHVRYRESDIDAWLDAQARTSTAATR